MLFEFSLPSTSFPSPFVFPLTFLPKSFSRTSSLFPPLSYPTTILLSPHSITVFFLFHTNFFPLSLFFPLIFPFFIPLFFFLFLSQTFFHSHPLSLLLHKSWLCSFPRFHSACWVSKSPGEKRLPGELHRRKNTWSIRKKKVTNLGEDCLSYGLILLPLVKSLDKVIIILGLEYCSEVRI